MTIALGTPVLHTDGRRGAVSDVRDDGRSVYVTFWGGAVEKFSPEEVERWATRSEYAGYDAKAKASGFTWKDEQ